ncbi:LLM class flavin-dependent oxidoreductase [Spongiactinospora gelatinilytica]|uniref:LLM class flavin-dependent oxidoreductase n=1 Tax=Spongiactinospora gelatinilytica TaxID=2666298 RepID=A0A2W2HS33_9ACTN|nr:LLM class flavin-dependent oxidoreductase [Spongiactinospora gelatinilytica]PZG54425.1 LLM class flavin-dependent oxidoreductase [Spongiactinospora gelatinilytica]
MTATARRPRLGVVLGSSQSPAQVVAAAQVAESAGFDELWVGEDYFFTGAIATAGALLAATELPVGIGIVPTASRHPALLAMEVATLAGIYPGRLTAGVGVGVPDWLDAMRIRPTAALTAVRETLTGLRTLLQGESLTTEGRSYAADGIRLEHPPTPVPPLYAGVGGPKALRMAGGTADGTVLSVLAGTEYIRWAVAQLQAGGAGPDHRVVAYALCSVGPDAATARDRLRELFGLYLLTGPRNPMTEAHGIADEAAALAELDFADAVAKIPDAWLEELAVVGTPADCARRLTELAAAGADSIALCLVPDDDGGLSQLRTMATDLLPLLPEGRTR